MTLGMSFSPLELSFLTGNEADEGVYTLAHIQPHLLQLSTSLSFLPLASWLAGMSFSQAFLGQVLSALCAVFGLKDSTQAILEGTKKYFCLDESVGAAVEITVEVKAISG